MQTVICTLLAASVPSFAAASFAIAPQQWSLHGAAHTARGLTEAGDECTYNGDAESNGCKWLSNCADCGGSDQQCVGDTESQAWEDARDSLLPTLAIHVKVCGNIAATAYSETSGRKLKATTTTGCPSASVVAGFSEEDLITLAMMNLLMEVTDEYVEMVATADGAKEFVTSYCASVPDEMLVHLEEEGLSSCTSATFLASGIASESDACSGLSSCAIDEMMLNKDCFTGLATAWGVSTATIDTIHEAMDDLHTACQAITTEDACHAFDGSEYIAILEDTAIEMTVTTGTSSSALPQKAGVAMAVAAAVAFAVMLVA